MMNNIIKEISSDSINFYIEQNLDDFYNKSSKHPNFISYIEDKMSWVLAKNADWPECIYRVNFEKFDIENEINNVKQLILQGKVPNGWTIGPLTKPKNLGKILENYGFSNVYHQAGMAIYLENLINQSIDEKNLIVEIIENEESLNSWVKVVSSVFGIKVDYELIEFLFLEPEVKFYIGNFEGKPVSSLMLYLSSGVAGLHAVSTFSDYRNKGFGLTISRAALINAFEMGYRIGVLQASALGKRIYRRLGFKKYCDIISYELT